MWNVTGRSKGDSIRHCEQEVICEAVKVNQVNQVTGTRRKECILLANSGFDTYVMATDLLEKN